MTLYFICTLISCTVACRELALNTVADNWQKTKVPQGRMLTQPCHSKAHGLNKYIRSITAIRHSGTHLASDSLLKRLKPVHSLQRDEAILPGYEQQQLQTCGEEPLASLRMNYCIDILLSSVAVTQTAYKTVVDDLIYGSNYFILRKRCIGHVLKGMGKNSSKMEDGHTVKLLVYACPQVTVWNLPLFLAS